MADYTVTIHLPDHKRGDKWPGVAPIGPILVNGTTPAGTLARVRMHLVHSSGLKYKLDSDPATAPAALITIDNPVTWAAHIGEVQEFLPIAGDWQWDMEFYRTGDLSPLTFYEGTLTVRADRSN
jgi:hypothetical protein